MTLKSSSPSSATFAPALPPCGPGDALLPEASGPLPTCFERTATSKRLAEEIVLPQTARGIWCSRHCTGLELAIIRRRLPSSSSRPRLRLSLSRFSSSCEHNNCKFNRHKPSHIFRFFSLPSVSYTVSVSRRFKFKAVHCSVQ